MSTTTIETSKTSTERSAARTVVDSQPATLPRAVKAEWIKFRSLRSTWAVLGAAVLGMLAIGLIIAFNTRNLTGNQDPNDLAPSAPLQGFMLAQLLIGALGVLFVSSEFGTGMIRSTFAAVPKRLPVLWAKLAVFVAVTAVLMTVTSLITFLASQAVIGHYRTGYSLSSPGALQAVFGTALYLVLVGVIGGMIGWIVRSTPGALVTYFALILVLPVLGLIFGTWGKDVAQFLPSQAGQAFTSNVPESPHLSSGVGLLVLCAWVVAGVVLATISLRRRDA